MCGCSFPGKENRTRNQESPISAIALTLPRQGTSLANLALVLTPVKWGEEFQKKKKYYENTSLHFGCLVFTLYSS